MRKNMPIFYSALLLTGVNLLLRLAGTSFHVYISGQIGAVGVGLLQLVMSVGSLALTAGMAGIRTSSMYLTAEELGHKKEGNVTWVLSGCFTYSILCSGIVSLALYIAAPYFAENWIGDARTVGSIRLLAGFLPVSCLSGVMSGYFTAARRIGTLAAVEVAEQLISITATLLLLSLWAGSDSAKACQAVVLGGGLSGCFTLCILVILRLKEKQPTGKKIRIGQRLATCAIPLAGADLLKSGISTTENILVPKRLALYPGGKDPLATFGTVCGMVFPVLMFPAAILFGLAELLIPELARCAAANSHLRIRYLVRRSLRITMLYGLLFGGLMYLLAESLCVRLYGSLEAGFWLKRFALLIPMLYCDAITDAMTKGLGQQRICVRYNIITSTLDVILLFVLLPRYGMQGYFWSFTLTHAINFVLSLQRLIKTSKVSLTFRPVLLGSLATILAVFVASALQELFWCCLSCIILLLCLLALGKVVHKEDAIWLISLIRKK